MEDFKTFFIFFHILGAVIGAGGAYVSDAMFFSAVKDKIISKTELRFLKIGSMFVWVGLAVLFISGFFIFLTNPSGYLASSKFLIKMFIVGMIALNGFIFHFRHIGILHRHAGHHYPSSDEFVRNKNLLIASGVVSVTSWTLALILGSIGSIPISFFQALLGYFVIEVAAISFGIFFFRKKI